jgi:glycosyltransferase involved in cell wall biosynthesis
MDSAALDERGPAATSVCFLTQTDGFGGTEIHTLGLLGLLHSRGHRIELVQCGHLQYEHAIRPGTFGERLRIRLTPLSVKADASSLGRWATELAALESNVLIFPMGAHDLATVDFLRLCRRRFSRVYLIEHLEAPRIGRRRHLEWLLRKRLAAERARAACADRIIAVSESVRERLIADYAHPPEKVVVARNGVRWREFQRDPAKGEAFRARHGIAPDAFVFGMMTRLAPVKGIDIALEALRRLSGFRPARPVQLVVAGGGPEGATLERLADQLGVRKYVTFTGFVDTPLDALCAFDAIVFSSRREGLPLGLLEAMAAGCLPVVARIGGMPEVVYRPQVGWVVPPESPQELCAAMLSVLELDQRSLAAMRKVAEGRIREAFDIDTCHRRILEVCAL